MKSSVPFGGLHVFEPVLYSDERGSFMESWSAKTQIAAGITDIWIQDNESKSKKGVLRGLHYQVSPYSQAKLVRVVSGLAFDVAVDIRPDSPTYGHWFGILLGGENKLQLYIPPGFAHGFAALDDNTIFVYKCSTIYHKASEGSIHPLDPSLNIDWPLHRNDIILSEKDALGAAFGQHRVDL